MIARDEWDDWGARWRADRQPAMQLDEVLGGVARARRSLLLTRALSLAIAVSALGVIAVALRHAGNPVEATLGLVVGAAIAAAWFADAANRRRSIASDYAAATDHPQFRREVCLRQLRFVRLGWTIVVLDLVFLVPWWIGGLRVHGFGFHVAQIASMWLPVAVMTTFVLWTRRTRRRARAELEALTHAAQIQEAYREA